MKYLLLAIITIINVQFANAKMVECHINVHQVKEATQIERTFLQKALAGYYYFSQVKYEAELKKSFVLSYVAILDSNQDQFSYFEHETLGIETFVESVPGEGMFFKIGKDIQEVKEVALGEELSIHEVNDYVIVQECSPLDDLYIGGSRVDFSYDFKKLGEL